MKKAGLKATLGLIGAMAASPAFAICNITVESDGGFLTGPTSAAAITHDNLAEIAERAQSRGMNRSLGSKSWAYPLGRNSGIGSTSINVYPFGSAARQCASAFDRAIANNPGETVGVSFLCRGNLDTAISVGGGRPSTNFTC